MKIQVHFFYCCFALMLLVACQQKDKAPNKTTPELLPIEVNFTCTPLEEVQGIPRHVVYLDLNGQQHLLDTIAACDPIEPADYERYAIPGEALTACGGWWAGAGDYFYALQEGNAYLVMQGWQDEQQEDEGFHYKQIRRLVLSSK